MKLSVIIVAWQAAARIEQCLSMVQQSLNGITGEIIVIDNGSTDQTAALVRQHFPTVRLVTEEKNTGFAAANNVGWQLTDSEYLLLLNDDAMVNADTIPALVTWLDQHPATGGVTCRFDNPDGSIQRGYHRGLPTLGRMVASFFSHYLKITTPAARSLLLLNNDFTKEQVIEQAAATCLLLRRSAVEKAGGLFDDHFPIFFNDVDLSHRLNDAGTPVWLTPTTRITHLRAQSTERIDPYEAKAGYYTGLLQYFKKHHRFGDYLIGKVAFWLLLGGVYLLTSAGALRSYFGTPITDRAHSLKQQKTVLLRIATT